MIPIRKKKPTTLTCVASVSLTLTFIPNGTLLLLMNAKVKNVTKSMNKKTSCSWIKLPKVTHYQNCVFSEQYEIPYVRRK